MMDSSCVKNEIRTFSRMLMKYIKIVDHTVLEINAFHVHQNGGRGGGRVFPEK
jgi:hypothetical protein